MDKPRKITGALCELCPLYDQPFVPPTGPVGAQLAVVGEAPGGAEVRQKQPFVGESGRLLNRVLTDAHIERGDVYITNAVKCRPPMNVLDDYVEAIDCCQPALIEELRDAAPKTIIAAGKTAGRALLGVAGVDKITKERGKQTMCEALDVPVRLTVHPAYVLRVPKAIADLRRDFEMPFDQQYVQGTLPAIDWHVLDTITSVFDWIADVCAVPRLIAYDLETDGLNPFQIDKPILCVALAWSASDAVVIAQPLCTEPQVKAALTRLFADPQHRFVGHNARYDNMWLEQRGIVPPAEFDDTMLMHSVGDERTGIHGLKKVAQDLLGVGDWDAALYAHLPKAKRKKAAEAEQVSFADVPHPVLYKYASYDVCMTWALVKPLQERINRMTKGTFLLRRVLYPALHLTHDMWRGGLKIDRPLLVDTLQKYEVEQAQLVEQLCDFAGDKHFNPGSTQQLGRLLFDTLGLDVQKRTPKGAPSTDASVLEALELQYADQHIAAFDLILAYRKLDKVIGTYLRPMLFMMGDDDKLRFAMNLHTSATGRLTAGTWLTWPRPSTNKWAAVLRYLVIAEPGHVIGAWDFDQFELRVVTVEAQDEIYRDVFLAGGDPHASTADVIYPDLDWRKLPDAKRYRGHGKTVNFGVLYGEGAKKLALQTGLPLEVARAILQQYYTTHFAITNWITRQHKLVHSQGYVESWSGRRRRFELLLDKSIDKVYREAVNSPIQTTANDLNLMAAVEVQKWLRTQTVSEQSRVLLLFHDSVIAQLPEDKAVEFADKIQQIMQDVPTSEYSQYVPFTVDKGIGKSWGLAEQKD